MLPPEVNHNATEQKPLHIHKKKKDKTYRKLWSYQWVLQFKWQIT